MHVQKRHTLRLFTAGLVALTALLASTSCAQTFTVRILAHVPRNVTSVSLNDNGWAVWTTGLGNSSQVFLWAGSEVIPLGFPNRNNRDARINNNDWVVWSAIKENDTGQGSTDIFVWKGDGIPESVSAGLDSSAEPVINDRNDIAWWSSHEGIHDVFYLPAGSSTYQNLTEFDAVGASAMPQIDNNGYISWVRTIEIAPHVGASNLVFSTTGSTSDFTQITFRDDLNVYNYGMTSSGKLVWVQYNDAVSRWEVWEYNRNTGVARAIPGSQTQFFSPPAVREDGTIAFPVYITTLTYRLYWHRNGVTEPIPITTPYTQNRPVALNNRGQILFASGNSSATGFYLMLATPSNALPSVSGRIQMEGIVTSAPAQRITLTFRPSSNAPEFTRRVMLAPNGTFTVYNVPPDQYLVRVKGKKWLATALPVNTMGGHVENVTLMLRAGDANNDNMVDVLDLAELIAAFDATPGTANWNDGRADLNCDNMVDVLDLDLLVRNFDLEGAP